MITNLYFFCDRQLRRLSSPPSVQLKDHEIMSHDTEWPAFSRLVPLSPERILSPLLYVLPDTIGLSQPHTGTIPPKFEFARKPWYFQWTKSISLLENDDIE